MNPLTERDIRSALRGLGDSARQIATSLAIFGCKGPVDCEFCPIATYLEMVFGSDHNIKSIRIYQQEIILATSDEVITFKPNQYVARFIRMFDRGHFTFLHTNDEVL